MQPKDPIYFRDQFRKARAVALRDAEDFQELLFCLEKLGLALTNKITNLDKYESEIRILAEESPLAKEIPTLFPDWHLSFSHLYGLVRNARNEAFHQGAFARHLTGHAINLSIILEDALMSSAKKISDYMVRETVCAYSWQPISFIRQQMLANSFSYLPVYVITDCVSKWFLVADYDVAGYLHYQQPNSSERRNRLATILEDAVSSGTIKLSEAPLCKFDESIEDVLKTLNNSNARPILVTDDSHPEVLVGIVTAFDLL